MSAATSNSSAPDSTEIFRMPSADATVPDPYGSTKTYSLSYCVKGPRTGQTFVSHRFLLVETQRAAFS